MTRTHRTCCCKCGNKPCDGNEYRYEDTSGTCPICAIGDTTFVENRYETPAPFASDNWLRDPDRNPNNLYVGNKCLEPLSPNQTWPYQSECSWAYEAYNEDCWYLYPMDPPELIFYQTASPWGFMAWTPQVMEAWRRDWGGPLVPGGDCTMHCTEDNIGCHSLAFVGSLGKDFGSEDNGDIYPNCGADVVTLPSRNRDDWEWIRNWVLSGGKLVIMGESKGSQIGGIPACERNMQFFKPSRYYSARSCGLSCDEVGSEEREQISGAEVSEFLKEFAEYTGYKDAEDLLYYTLRTVARQICYEKFLSGINV